MLKIYLAGKIAGDPHYAEKFAAAADEFTKRGATVLSPSALPAGMNPRDYMRICLAMIDTADAVYFMPDWTESEGATLERYYCKYVSKTIAADPLYG